MAGNLTLLIGLPGSGKSTYLKKYEYNRIVCGFGPRILSSDNLRKFLFKDENDQTHNEELFDYIKESAVKLLERGYDVIIDATNITRKNRQSIVNYVENKITGYLDWCSVKYIVFATPYYQCLINNRKRERQVPEEVIKRMYKNFEFPTYNEVYNCNIKIIYPFKLDKELYGQEHPYQKLMKIKHDTPYHKYTIGEHIEKTYDIMKILSNDKVILKAAELHDIGKPFVKEWKEDGSRARFLNHANVGSYEAMFYGKMAKFTEEEIIELCNLIQFHMRIWDCKDNEKATNKLRNIISSSLYYKLLMLNIADREAH